MAETTKIVIEGEVALAYFADYQDSRRVLLQPEKSKASDELLACSNHLEGGRLEAKIATALGFPTSGALSGVSRRLEQMSKQGLRPAANVPMVTRDGVRLRITVEVL